MSNVSRPHGLRPDRFISGANWNGQFNLYYNSPSQAGNVFIGDLVQIDTTNRNSPANDPFAQGIPAIQPVTAAAGTARVRGVVVGFAPQPYFSQSATASLGLKYRVASTARYSYVVDDPSVVYEIEESGTATTNGVNASFDITYTAGNTISGISGVTLNAATRAVTQLPLRVIRNTQKVGYFIGLAAQNFDVIIGNGDLIGINAATNGFWGA